MADAAERVGAGQRIGDDGLTGARQQRLVTRLRAAGGGDAQAQRAAMLIGTVAAALSPAESVTETFSA